ncbi:MAG: 16S rRNA (adenine(1518)-N(6)/adenine(1519)-N(6))-dimethyltransferase RsmA [Acholeplasmataceae bacterium]|nr:16S rRNA (adenine(1518)-N(6)/adenine(1519)-N(6))-dimethyltransferase RsmA [Acholeplasmataceae bacterium]
MSHQMKKKFGQNFVTDKNLLAKIVRLSDVTLKDVIEIGPGMGSLTTQLCMAASTVTAYEIDLSLKPYLDALTMTHDNLEVIYQDILETDLNALSGIYHVVANVPYYITTPILFKILESPNIKTASLMVQKEVADRLLSEPGKKTYNALSVILQDQADVHKIVDVPRRMFYPMPNVDSIVIRIVKHESDESATAHERFRSFVKAAFTQKRKTLLNNLHEVYGVSKEDIAQVIKTYGHDPAIRAERLSVSQFREMFKGWTYDR